MIRLIGLSLLAACTASTPIGDPSVEVVDLWQVVPSDGLDPDAAPMDANNNLDVIWFEDRLYLAFRTSPNHFASSQTRMVVVSTTDEVDWRWEGEFSLDTDLREPQLVILDGELWLYFAELGSSPIAFEPAGSWRSRFDGTGSWVDPERVFDADFIPWRIKPADGAWQVFGYTGGGNIYEMDGEPISIHWLRSTDGVAWEPVVGDGVVQVGGGSETDAVLLDDGSLVAVTRNEAGDETGFGSKVCTAPADDLGSWTCDHDPRKYDSPLMFRAAGRVWLVGRRNVTEDGAYDLGRDDLSLKDQALLYQSTYWGQPKRCAVWTVDAETRTVSFVADLPSRGDTCFPELVEHPDGRLVLYNYSSPLDGVDPSWLGGQTGLTGIYRMELDLR